MSEPIKIGDLVLLLWAPYPEAQKFMGEIRTVAAPSRVHVGHWQLDPPTMASCGAQITWHSSRLKRIPPLDELEGTKQDEEMTA